MNEQTEAAEILQEINELHNSRKTQQRQTVKALVEEVATQILDSAKQRHSEAQQNLELAKARADHLRSLARKIQEITG